MAPLDISLCHLDIVSQTARHKLQYLEVKKNMQTAELIIHIFIQKAEKGARKGVLRAVSYYAARFTCRPPLSMKREKCLYT